MTRPRVELADLPSMEAEIRRRSFAFNRRPGARNNRGRVPEQTGGAPAFPSSVVPSLWLDGRVAAYSDAAQTVPALAPLGRVHKVPQPAPLSGVFTSSNTTDSRPFRDATSFCFETTPVTGLTGRGLNLDAPAGSTLPFNAVTLAFSLTARTYPYVANAQCIIEAASSVGNTLWALMLDATNQLIMHANTPVPTGIVLPFGVPVAGVVCISPTGVRVTVSIGGVKTTVDISATIPAGTGTSIKVCSDTYFNVGLNASIAQLLVVPRTITTDEADALCAWLVATPPALAFPTSANLLVCVCDSIGLGVYMPSAQTYAYRALPALEALGPQLKYMNAGLAGGTLADVQATFNTVVAPLYSSSRSRNAAIVQCATNSMAFGSLTAAQVISQYWALCDNARSIGFRVGACTVLPRTDSVRGTFEADRTTFNAEVTANWASHAEVFCNFAAVAGMGAAGDSNNTTNYPDLVHPSPTGAGLLLPTYQAAATALLS